MKSKQFLQLAETDTSQHTSNIYEQVNKCEAATGRPGGRLTVLQTSAINLVSIPMIRKNSQQLPSDWTGFALCVFTPTPGEGNRGAECSLFVHNLPQSTAAILFNSLVRINKLSSVCASCSSTEVFT